MVVWSTRSVESDWVREEADEGLKREVLVPVQIDDCSIPLGFRRRHAAQLIGWPKGQHDLAGVITRVEKTVGRSAQPAMSKPRTRRNVYISLLVGLVAVTAIGLGYYHRTLTRAPEMLSEPEHFFGKPIEQQVKFTQTSDGVRIAYATSGHGPPIVEVVTIYSNLENGLNSGLYDEHGLIQMSSRENLFVRYDGRGLGLSDRDIDDFSIGERVKDLEAVTDALGLQRFGLLGSSSGSATAIAYTAKHPNRVTRLVLAGGFARVEFDAEPMESLLTMVSNFWDGAYPIGSDMLARIMLPPDVEDDRRLFMAEMLRRSQDGQRMAALLRANMQIDVTEEARQIAVPTLIISGREDATVPVERARELLALISDARLELFDGAHEVSSANVPETRRRALNFLNTGN